MNRNRGHVYIGTSADTPQFAVDCIATWWQHEGGGAFPANSPMLILADAGGSNSYRSRVWKQQLQEQLSDLFGLTVTVCHYPARRSVAEFGHSLVRTNDDLVRTPAGGEASVGKHE